MVVNETYRNKTLLYITTRESQTDKTKHQTVLWNLAENLHHQ